ncbi:MAG TPA: hypothetical protein VHB50_04360 [Bryobacteraceae bacterium]|nr:hypothetical protein [Bryobacteraceae bacterium]
MRTGAYENPDEVIDRALEVLRERDEWLCASRQAIHAKIRRGMEELERRAGVPEDELDAAKTHVKEA